MLEGHLSYVIFVTFSLDGQKIVFGFGDKMIKVWNAMMESLLQILNSYSSFVSFVAFLLDG